MSPKKPVRQPKRDRVDATQYRAAYSLFLRLSNTDLAQCWVEEMRVGGNPSLALRDVCHSRAILTREVSGPMVRFSLTEWGAKLADDAACLPLVLGASSDPELEKGAVRPNPEEGATHPDDAESPKIDRADCDIAHHFYELRGAVSDEFRVEMRKRHLIPQRTPKNVTPNLTRRGIDALLEWERDASRTSSAEWKHHKPTVAGTYLLYCAEWKIRTRMVELYDKDGVPTLKQSPFTLRAGGVREEYGVDHNERWAVFNECSLDGFNSLAKRCVWWFRLEFPA